MVVHDMRNPTNQIEYTLQQSLEKFLKLKKHLEALDYSINNLDTMESQLE